HTCVVCDGGGPPAASLKAPVLSCRNVERCMRGEDPAQPGSFGHRLALRLVRLEFAMQSAFRDLGNDDQRTPGISSVLSVGHGALACSGMGKRKAPLISFASPNRVSSAKAVSV